jgi:hypothetical protein
VAYSSSRRSCPSTKDAYFDDTIVIFTSDNGGTHQFTAPLRGSNGDLYEGGVHVPRSRGRPIPPTTLMPTAPAAARAGKKTAAEEAAATAATETENTLP